MLVSSECVCVMLENTTGRKSSSSSSSGKKSRQHEPSSIFFLPAQYMAQHKHRDFMCKYVGFLGLAYLSLEHE